MSRWPEAYATGAFRITTDQPSGVVRDYARLIPNGSKIADLGCGSGRNALFLAGQGHAVDAFDVADLGWHQQLNPELSKVIHFNQQSVESIAFDTKSLGAVLMMRLIQYLPLAQVEELIGTAHQGLMEGGIMFMNYTVSGGGHDIPELAVEKHSHPFSKILEIVNNTGMQIVYSHEADMPPLHTSLDSDSIHACDLVALRK